MKFISLLSCLLCVFFPLMAEKIQTFSMIKPQAVAAGNTGAILDAIEKSGLKIIAIRMARFDDVKAKAFYQEHQGKPFFPILIEKMTEGPIVALVIEGDDAIIKLRTVIGSTDPKKAAEGTIRARFGKTITENAIHASDSTKSASREIPFFFQKEDLFPSN
jgi:nucleoside-diphosphate kinase